MPSLVILLIQSLEFSVEQLLSISFDIDPLASREAILAGYGMSSPPQDSTDGDVVVFRGAIIDALFLSISVAWVSWFDEKLLCIIGEDGEDTKCCGCSDSAGIG